MQETQERRLQSLGQENSLEEEMATHMHCKISSFYPVDASSTPSCDNY